MKTIIISTLFISYLTSGIYIHKPKPKIKLDNLAYVESRHRDHIVSKVGAIGRYQITTNCLSHYNWDNRTQIRPSELFNRETNEMVAVWYIRYLYKFYSHLEENDRLIALYSAYNLGQYRTQFASNQILVYRPYVQKIIPENYYIFQKENKLLWKGKNIDLWQIE